MARHLSKVQHQGEKRDVGLGWVVPRLGLGSKTFLFGELEVCLWEDKWDLQVPEWNTWKVFKCQNWLPFQRKEDSWFWKVHAVSSLSFRDEVLSLWNGSTDSKTLDYQRTNPRKYQIVRTHTKETTWIQDPHHPTTSSTQCRMPHLNKQSKNTNPVISRQDYHFTQPCPSEEKQTKPQHKSHPIWSLQKPLDQP